MDEGFRFMAYFCNFRLDFARYSYLRHFIASAFKSQQTLLVNKTDFQALEGPTVTGPVQDPLAVTRLDNRLYIFERSQVFFTVV